MSATARPLVSFVPNLAAERHHAIVVAAVAATYLQAVNISIPNAALLRVEGATSMADDEIGWVFSAYIAASAVVMPLTRWLAGEWGRKAVFQLSLLVFATGLFLATRATTPLGFVGARIIQGAASGPIAPLAMAILLEETPPDHHARIGLLSTVTALTGILTGPAIGGWFSENSGWRWMFYSGLPVAGIIFLTMAWGLKESRPARNPAFDFFGFATFSFAMVGLQMFLDRGERIEWFASIESWLEICISALGFYLFAVHVLTSNRHFLDKALFRDRNFVLSTVIFFAFGFVLLPTLALTSPMLEELLGYPPDTTGYMTIPRGAALIGALILASRAPGKLDPRLLVLGGIALVVYGNWEMLGYSALMDWRLVAVAGAIQGAGLGVLMAALAKTAFSTLDPSHRPEGTAFFNLSRLYGSTLGIAVVQIFVYDNTQMMHLALAKHLTPHHAVGRVAEFFSGRGLAVLNDMLTGQAALIAVIDQFKLLMIVILAVSPLALLLRKPGAIR
jgi:MFS transporter, DHA2 family, multidrug resistance protein